MKITFLRTTFAAGALALCAAAVGAASAPRARKPHVNTTFTPSAVMRLAESPAARHWADSVYNTLTERQRVAQLMCPKVVTNQGENTRAVLRRLVHDEGVGALLFTEGSARQHAEAISYAQSISDVPVMITFDGEWGVAMRVSDIPAFPRNMTLGAVRNDSLIYMYGQETARQCRALGVHVNFAPVADVNSNPRNPVIGNRSFGEDPANVARKVTAYSRGLEDGGVQSVAKHFPGHGDTDTDSHKALPTLDKSLDMLQGCEFVPFATYIDSGLSGIMVAHMDVPAVGGKGAVTSLSSKTYGMLRKKMGFRGLIYTDALGMKGAETPDGTNNALAALRAGADVLECANATTDIDAIMTALKKGKLKKSVIEDRCKRVLAYKYALGLTQRYTVDAGKALAAGNDARAMAMNRNLVAASMTCVFNHNGILPLKNLDSRSIAVVCIGAAAGNEFASYCRRYAGCDIFAAPNSTLTSAQLREIKRHNTIILAVFNHSAAALATFRSLAAMPGTVGVFFNGPLRDAAFVGADTPLEAMIEAYENTPLAREYAAQAIFGGIKVNGMLPAEIPGVAKAGEGVILDKTRLGYTSPAAKGYSAWLTDSIDSICNDLVAREGTPGMQVLVAKGGDVIVDASYGTLTKGGAPVNFETMYDLASVSKALGTLPGIMIAVDSGYIDVEKPISTYIPGMRRDDKKDLLVKEFLFHQTGIPAAINVYPIMFEPSSYKGALITGSEDAQHPIYVMPNAWGNKDAKRRTDILSETRTDNFNRPIACGLWGSKATTDTLMEVIYSQPVNPAKPYVYSCLNFCLLKDAEEHATGIPHDRWCSTRLWKPLGAWSISYTPAANGYDVANIAPTEDDTYLRRQMLQGYVHDETAAFMGGVSGNAGLFANANDMAKICQMWLNGGTYGGQRLISEDVVKRFTTEKSPTCRRGLGFDKPDTENPENSPTCDEAGPEVFGHLGFTGTVFWVDPKNDIIFIYLTNRVNPSRNSPVFNASGIRPELFRQTLRALAGQEQTK